MSEVTESDAKQLDQEGDVAADYLEGLLDICDLDGDIDIEVDGRPRRSHVAVRASHCPLTRSRRETF